MTRLRASDIPDPAPLLERRRPLGHFRRDIDELFQLAESMGEQGSPTGGQLDTLRLGLTGGGDEHLARRANAAEEKQHRYAMLCVAWGKLTALQQQVLMAQRTPCGQSVRVVQARAGNLVELDRLGGEIIGARRRLEDGTQVFADEDCVFVALTVPTYPKREQIALQLGVPVDKVRRAATGARETWERVFADDKEDGQ